MARPLGGVHLTIAQLQQLLDGRRDEINKLRKERSDLQREIDQIDRRIERLDGNGGGGGGSGGGGGGGPRRGVGSRVRNEMSLNDTIEKVLRDNGKPMRVTDLTDAILKTGYKTNSANFRGIVNQSLIKDRRFNAAERGLYQLKK